jgi:hypothetical protein
MTDSRDLDETLEFVSSRLRRLESLPKDAETRELAARFLTGNERLSPVEQLEVYRVQFWLRHTAALLEDFPGVSGILGQDEWEKLAESYLSRVPPKSYSLRNLGDRLAEHIADRLETPHRELCVDMARLEWAYVEVFDAEDAPPLSPEELLAIPESAWATARFECSKALRLLELGHPVADLRRTLRRSQVAGSSGPIEIPDARRQCLAAYRGTDRELYFKVLAPVAFAVLRRLAAGEALIEACERVAGEDGSVAAEIEQNVGNWFLDWGRRGFFSRVRA